MPNPPTPPAPPAHISFEQFTESTLGAVLRAVEAQKLPHAPIIIGIVWNPEGLPNPSAAGAAAGGTPPR
jgi:hypothetical protein